MNELAQKGHHMGDSRFTAYYERMRDARDRNAELRSMPDEGVIAALAASHDPYLSNVLATEAMNRLQRPRMRRHLAAHDPGLSHRRVAEAVAAVEPGQHLCAIYETQAEQFSVAIPYLCAGLEKGERCIYITSETDAPVILQALRERGCDADAFVASGALLVLSKRDTYLKDGHFDPDRMVTTLQVAVDDALAAGYPSLRVVGETTWALGEEIGRERLLEYESKVNHCFTTRKASAICLYDGRLFEASTLEGLVETHPQLVHAGLVCENFYYVPPEEFLDEDAPRKGLERLLERIRERAEAESEILRLNQDLEHLVVERTRELHEVIRELESFSYAVSHDLRAPLRGIDFYAQALVEDHGAELSDDGRELLTRMRGESQRLGALVSHLLSLASVARAELSPVTLDLSEMAQEVVATLRTAEPAREVEIDIEPQLVATGDPHLMRVVLENLLGNAWKFTRRTPAARITFTMREHEGERTFEVHDNGAGFDPARAHRLFEVFSRLHAATEYEGNGVGLATVARVVRRHGGHVSADSRPGEGATFRFTLPAQPAARVTVAAGTDANAAPRA